MKHTLIVAAQSKQDRPKGWRDVLPVHPAADLFPLMGKEELCELADDIKKNGLLEQIVVYDDLNSTPCICVLEGRNRLDALELIGRETVNINGDPTSPIFTKQSVRKSFDPYAYVLSKNVHRRHLTAEQRRDLIAKVLKAKPETSNLQIAKQVKADDKTVAKVRTKLEATSEISKLTKTVGKDGKSRPVRKKQAPEKPAGSLNESPRHLRWG